MRKLLSLTIVLLLAASLTAQVKIGGTAKLGGTVKVNVQPGGGGSDFASDVFTEASDINLIDRTPTLGGPYIEHPTASYSGISLKLDSATDRVFGIGTDLLYFTATPPSADYYVQADFCHVSTIAVNIAVAGRVDATADTLYMVRLNGGTTWEMRKIIATVASTLTGGTSTTGVPSVGNCATGRLIMAGDQLTFTVNSSTVIGPITDTDITAAGFAGIRTAGVSSASTGMHIDNFSAR